MVFPLFSVNQVPGQNQPCPVYTTPVATWRRDRDIISTIQRTGWTIKQWLSYLARTAGLGGSLALSGVRSRDGWGTASLCVSGTVVILLRYGANILFVSVWGECQVC